MKSHLIKSIVACLAAFAFAFMPLTVFADQCSPQVCSGNYPEAVKAGCGCSNVSNSDKLPSVIQNILNGIIGVAGVIAVIYVIIGGINYMTSGGDTGKLEKAKKTILYACIGLAVCALSFAIVNFAIKIIYTNNP